MIYQLPANTKTTHILESAINDLRKIISYRLQSHTNGHEYDFDAWLTETFDSKLMKPEILHYLPAQPDNNEWIVLLMAMVPHIQPGFFESLIAEHMPGGGDFPEFGGMKATNHRGVLPTGETAQLILAGTSLDERLAVQHLFREDHFFYRQHLLWLEPVKDGEPSMSGRLILSHEVLEKVLFGVESTPKFGLDFPAKRVTTSMIWEDIVLPQRTMQQVNDISIWLEHHPKIMEDENLKRKIKPGYRVLFYGSPGTGKTLTAALLGKQFRKDVYRIDLSQIVSKYIGETEKNLESVFHRAESKDWILFFDEADALFGKRTNVQSAHDKYANQEVSYLLQRVEDYPGLLILASNFRNNLDDAFIRRFHSIINFPLPNVQERMTIWQKVLPSSLSIQKGVDLKMISEQFELTGASILNAMQFATLQAFARGDKQLRQTDLLDAVKKEFLKEEKAF